MLGCTISFLEICGRNQNSNNMKYVFKIPILLLVAIALTNCGGTTQPTNMDAVVDSARYNSIYHWKTTFEVDSTELDFLKLHDIQRIYLRMFDVAVERDFLNGVSEIVPIATTKFLSAPPADVEIVPVAYITIDALRAMAGREQEFASLIVERLSAMASYNKCGEIHEIQLDCDWTASTKSSYHYLCQLVKETITPMGMKLSVTIRLHQLQESSPPADKGILMLYNTGALKNPETVNSILHIDDAKPYIKPTKYQIPLDYAYPTFGWGVKFEDDRFVSIVSEDAKATTANEYIRYERATIAEVLAVKVLVEQKLGKPLNGNILYHLDYTQLKNYTDDEISQIYSY